MPQEPKKRHSRERKGKRRASIHLTVPKFIMCSNCKSVTLPHMVCKKCGFYEGRQVLVMQKNNKKEEKSSAK
ncbi:MAG: 50S ribosomal protein L32 [Patescibacteria group bacterium]